MGRLETKKIKKHFGEVKAVDGVDTVIGRQGKEKIGLIGPNGAGKTTLINLLTGHLAPTTGQISLNGKDITGADPSIISNEGVVRTFQEPGIFPDHTVYENIRLPVMSRLGATRNLIKPPNSDEIQDETLALLREFGLEDQKETPCKDLPHGSLKLVEVAMAKGLGGSLYFFDEPLAGLSEQEIEDMLGRLEEVAEENLVVMVDHNVDAVLEFAERVLVMSEGKLIADGSPTEIRGNEEVKEVYFGNSYA